MYEDLDKKTIEKILAEPEPTLDRDETTIIYLDQNIWGNLHDGRHNPDSDYTDAYEIVRRAVDDGDAICPFSLARFFETDVISNERFKQELYELMIDLSNNFCLRNYFDAIGAEITAYLFRHVDILPEIDPAEQVFGRGLVDPAGRPRITVDGEPIDGEWKIHKLLRSEHVIRRIIQSNDHLAYSPTPNEDRRGEYVEKLEAIRQDAKDIGDTDQERCEQLMIESFRNDVLPALIYTAEQLPIKVNILSTIARDTAFSGFDGFFTQFPTYYTHLHLILGRDARWHREIEANDLEDVMALAVAIPYTDIVVTEQFFAGVAHEQGLHEQFDTTIRTNPHQLADHLTDI